MLLSLLVCLASITVIPIAHSHILQQRDAEQACDTKECNDYAEEILKSLDETADPCTDYYQYACGSWSEHNPMPPNEIHWSNFGKTNVLTNERLKAVLEEPENSENPEAVRKAQRFYRSCMDTAELERQGVKPLQKILNRLGGWPIAMPASAWKEEENSWRCIHHYYFQTTGHMFLININFVPDDENSTKFTISTDQNRQFPFNDRRKRLDRFSTRSAYLTTIIETANMFAQHSKKVSFDQLLKDATDIIYFESLLQNVTRMEEEDYNNGADHIKMSIGDLQKFYDSNEHLSTEAQIDWLATIKLIFEDVKDVEITSSTQIYVNCKRCILAMGHIMSFVRLRVMVNYMHWAFISMRMRYSNQKMRDIAFNMTHRNYDVIEQKPRWETCIDELPLRDGLGYLFVQKYFNDQVFKDATEMTDRIRNELKRNVEQVEWADNYMKQYMTGKLDHVKKEIGYPAWYKNKTAMDKLYKNVHIGRQYLQNILNFNKAELARELQFLSTGYPTDEWLDYPVTVNAFYYGPANTILLPAAQIQEPYFVQNMPNAVNYGFIGFIIGHELGHGLDNNGIHYDKEGTRYTGTLGPMLINYQDRARCYVHQYSNYTLDHTDDNGNPVQLDGALTQGENIADSLGIAVSFAAYERKQATDGKTPSTLKKLPNVDDVKLFFLSFAQGWCYEERKRNEPETHTDVHSPPKIRVNGPLANSAAFAKAYNCPVGSALNPQKKCNLWK